MNLPPEAASPPGETANGDTRAARILGDLHKNITMAQIAKAAGVSQGAISSLLNDRDYGIRVSEKTRERVFKVCREMGYIPNDLRAVVRMYPELGEFCFLIADTIEDGLSDPFVARMARAAMCAVSEPSRPLTLAHYDPAKDYSESVEALPYPVRSGVASKFLFYGQPNQSLIHQVIRRGLPVISLGTDLPTAGVVSILPDYVSASKMALEHLFKLGHRQIGIVSGPFGATESHIIELHHGIRQAFAELKAPIDAQNIVYGDLGYSSGVAAVEELLSHPVKPTAVFCLSDAAAAGVIAKAHTRGLRVPEDLSVVGCSDDFCAQIILPALTTVHIPAEEMARLGVREIDRMVREAMPQEPRRHLVPVKLAERGSSGPVGK
jgi:LacI family transcriptional regulator